MMKRNRAGGLLLVAALLLAAAVFGATPVVIEAQQEGRSTSNAPAGRRTRSPRSWRVRVALNTPVTVTLRAKNAPLEAIMADVQRQLGAPVTLSPLMRTQRVTLQFDDLPLETALQNLAPQPYIDYVISGDPALPPRCVAIYLNAMNEPPPPASSGGNENRSSFIIEGDTEDLTTQPANGNANPPLHVSFEENRLTVRARNQSLFMVLSEIADKVGIPFDSSYHSSQVVDVEFTDYTIEDAVRRLAPNVQLYTRTDLLTFETKPLRFALVAPPQAGR